MNRNDQNYIVIVEKIYNDANLAEIAAFLHRNNGLTKHQLKSLINQTTRVIPITGSLEDAERVKSELERLGWHTGIEKLVGDLTLPVPEKHYLSIKKELSKILRSRISMTLYYVDIKPKSQDIVIPSMIGLALELENCFRESDTVYSLNDTSFFLLGFSTDEEGADCLKTKVIQSLYKTVTNNIKISIGYAVFPDQIRTITELISVASESMEIVDRKAFTNDMASPPVKSKKDRNNAGELKKDNTIQLYFSKARGRLLKRFFSLDANELWAGLSRLPKANQEAFLYRLPYDFELAPALEKIIQSQSGPVEMDASTESRLHEIIYSMDLENSLVERYRLMEEISAKLNQADALPIMSHVAKRIMGIISDPDSSVENLTGVIETDSSLTLRILKIVNSAFYNYPQKTSSVKEAIVILGSDEILNLALGLAVSKTLSNAHLEGCCNQESLWHHTIGTAVIAQHLSGKFPHLKGISFFTAGLLHDIGKIFMMDNFPELYRRIHLDALKYNLPLYEVEEEKCNINHAKIGEIIAARWKLPQELVLAIAKHHQFLKKDKYSALSAIIGLADYLYYNTQASPVTTDVASSLSRQLSYGHYSILQELFKGFDLDKIALLTEESKEILHENSDLLALP